MCGCVNKNSLEKETFKAKTIKVNCFTFCFLNNNCAALHCAKVEALHTFNVIKQKRL